MQHTASDDGLYRGYIGVCRALWGLYRDNGKENGNHRDYGCYIGIIGYMLGLYRDNGKEMETTVVNRVYWGTIWG